MQSEANVVGISAVIPLHKVERYLPELLDSLSAQEGGEYRLELIFVDDGSPDRSAELAQSWLAGSGAEGRVIRQENLGVSGARNTGLAAATAEWVTFPDSDDVLDPAYFRSVAAFLARDGARIEVASTNLLRLREPDPTPRNIHALSFRFAAGDRVVDMDRHPDFFQLNVASAFFRRADLLDAGMRFRTGLHASEDALFVAEYLLSRPRRSLGLVADAKYVYRRRAAADSAVDGFRREPSTYIERFRDGYLPLLREAAAQGAAPGWLQSMFLYECQWLLPAQLTEEGYARVLDADGRRATLDALAACAAHVSEARLFGYDATALPMESRLLLQLLAGRSLPAWLGVYTESADPQGARVVGYRERLAGAAPAPSPAVLVETPDYFGQRVLERVRQTLRPGQPVAVVGATIRRVFRSGPGESVAEQLDRHRRRMVGGSRLALPAREGEVRVWKPIAGPGGSPVARLRRVRRILIMRRDRARARRRG